MRNTKILPILLCLLCLLGCNNFKDLGGKVTFSDDKAPVPTGTIFFATASTISQGAIKPDGTFTVGSFKVGDGLPPGEYQVFFGGVESVSEEKLPDGTVRTTYTPLIDAKYMAAETSGLTFTVDGKAKRFDIELDRARSR